VALLNPRGAVVSLAVWLVLAAAPSVSHAGAITVGASVPNVALADFQGGAVHLDGLRGRLVLIDFWASWCQACRTILPALDALSRRYPPSQVEFLAVNIDTDRERADQFLAERIPRPNLHLVADPGGTVMARFGASGMPALYVADRLGIVRLVESGYTIDRLAEVQRLIDTLLDAAPPAGSAGDPPAPEK